MSLPKEITANTWVKNWSGNWRTAFASLYFLYTTDLKQYTGKNLDMNLLVCERESSSNYLAKEDLDAYGTHVAMRVIKDKGFAEKFAKDTLASAQRLFELLNTMKTEEDLTTSNLLELKKRFYAHIPPHFSMKKMIDYLPEDLQKKISPMLIEARLKTENLFNQVDATLREYTRMIARISGYPETTTEFLTIDEILLFLEHMMLPSKKELTERSAGAFLFCKGDACSLFLGADYHLLQKALVDSSKTELKGTIGYRGIAKGKQGSYSILIRSRNSTKGKSS